MNSPTSRAELRKNLLAQRQTCATAGAQAALSAQLRSLLHQIEPECLGVYWAMPGEFDAVAGCLTDSVLTSLAWALPYAQKMPPQMHYRLWDKGPINSTSTDECGLPSPTGPVCVPDVLLVPCLGYTQGGYRLGYGGGYFDRYLAANPGVTAIGLAWAEAEVTEAQLQPQAHDVALTLVLTQNGVAAAP